MRRGELRVTNYRAGKRKATALKTAKTVAPHRAIVRECDLFEGDDFAHISPGTRLTNFLLQDHLSFGTAQAGHCGLSTLGTFHIAEPANLEQGIASVTAGCAYFVLLCHHYIPRHRNFLPRIDDNQIILNKC